MIRFFRQYISPRKTIFVLGEGVLIFFAVSLAAVIMLGSDEGIITLLAVMWPRLLLISLITQTSLYFNDLYDLKRIEGNIDMATRLIQSIGITCILLSVLNYLLPDLMVGRWIFVIT